MSNTFAELIMLIFLVLPGIPAYIIYKNCFGADWRETQWDKIVNIGLFSLAGIIAYVLISENSIFPPPIYLIPSTFETGTFGVTSLKPIALSLTGHFILSTLIAFIAVGIVRSLGWLTPSTPYPSAWDDFIRKDVQGRWVVVGLVNNEAYAGYIKNADVSVSQAERDIVLAEPALYNEQEKSYKTIPYQQLFLPANMISSIAAVYDPQKDGKRIMQIGQNLFEENVKNVRKRKIQGKNYHSPAKRKRRQ